MTEQPEEKKNMLPSSGTITTFDNQIYKFDFINGNCTTVTYDCKRVIIRNLKKSDNTNIDSIIITTLDQIHKYLAIIYIFNCQYAKNAEVFNFSENTNIESNIFWNGYVDETTKKQICNIHVFRYMPLIIYTDEKDNIIYIRPYILIDNSRYTIHSFYEKFSLNNLTSFRIMDTLLKYKQFTPEWTDIGIRSRIKIIENKTIPFHNLENKPDIISPYISDRNIKLYSNKFKTTTDDKEAQNIEFQKQFPYMEWSITGPITTSDINHFSGEIKINKIICNNCCIGLNWKSCNSTSYGTVYCPDAKSKNIKTCPLKQHESDIHLCIGKDIGIEKNYVHEIETVNKKIDGKDMQLCADCLLNIDSLNLKFNPTPPRTPCKMFTETLIDANFWLSGVFLSIINLVISLSVVDLNEYSFDHSGISQDTFAALYSFDHFSISMWNITVLLYGILGFLLMFIIREICITHILIDNHNDHFVKWISDKVTKKNKIRSNNIIGVHQIKQFKNDTNDLYLIISVILLFSLCVTSFIWLCVLGPGDHPVIFTILILFKLKFIFTKISRFMHLNMIRICSADKHKTNDFPLNFQYAKDYKNDIHQDGDGPGKTWLKYKLHELKKWYDNLDKNNDDQNNDDQNNDGLQQVQQNNYRPDNVEYNISIIEPEGRI